MKYVVTIECDNAAFEGLYGTAHETARILRELADRVENMPNAPDYPLRDINGNRCGEAKFVG